MAQNANDQDTKQDGGGSRAGAGDGNQQKAVDQGGHAGTGGHGGQHSGGIGGEHGGDLHDVGSGQSGMSGRGGMGGNETGNAPSDTVGDTSIDVADEEQNADAIGDDEIAEVQQSAQREGMGHHRHNNRGHEQALDATADVDKLGSQERGAAISRKRQE